MPVLKTGTSSVSGMPLKNLSESNVLGSRKLVGIYIGWRGKSMHGLGTENLTYWDRKSVAQEVGKGGVTDVFIELEKD